MQIRFASAKLEKVLSVEKTLNRTYGQKMAKRVKTGLAVLMAADDLTRVPTQGSIRCHQLSADRDEQFAIDLEHPRRLVFEVDQHPIPRLEDGGIDKAHVTRIVVTEIIDYH
jgi:plasmid maintenance system killer protein